jgi:hypothetical protein
MCIVRADKEGDDQSGPSPLVGRLNYQLGCAFGKGWFFGVSLMDIVPSTMLGNITHARRALNAGSPRSIIPGLMAG